ncbi:MAG: hypothetical protein H0W88_07520 [Parachlamydiaceae bacterium]|nr:hypothetical protein [Parachlamydiaceae bacterium]
MDMNKINSHIFLDKNTFSIQNDEDVNNLDAESLLQKIEGNVAFRDGFSLPALNTIIRVGQAFEVIRTLLDPELKRLIIHINHLKGDIAREQKAYDNLNDFGKTFSTRPEKIRRYQHSIDYATNEIDQIVSYKNDLMNKFNIKATFIDVNDPTQNRYQIISNKKNNSNKLKRLGSIRG